MTLRTAQALRIVTVLLAAGLVLLGAVKLFDKPDKPQKVELKSDELGVHDAIIRSIGKRMAVRGYVFDGPGGLRLRICEGRMPGSPPSCLGPFIDIDGPGVGTLEFKTGNDHGDPVRWSPDPVTLVGPVSGTRMTVEEVLR